ncbi:DUF397 domain-containing protein [Nocardia seriolae]|uniref:DUF397 domain-containing protein n=1 Tax=Nocardia seriolae TaxID=37332 RepID=A0A0B8NHZ2_9NOCA|nr:DUF397 domain-containing protein [Nocardia seriolae]APA94817.1 hypothetical protein NS506_00738 [Nocardia seriolae]MTJ60110.1 DUF397 domain-containing protein [Nocardia seriolae]MTJ74380.1 DUF397 domain-containing protein [Nocardia seriolae]MTJ85110.1 DUF397 domain-containing protein [Nocardia seriolae]MTK29103.1 DUF397 domain-containing protein [Nocardia seriolae]
MYNLSGTGTQLRNAHFRKSTKSGNGPDCVEVAFLPNGTVAVRHSKAKDGHVLLYTPTEWSAFTAGVRSGEFDRP